MIRIGHITDLHARDKQPGTSVLSKRLSREVLKLLPKALRQLRERRVNFLAVTGDLLDVPDDVLAAPESHPRAFVEAIADYAHVKALLDMSAIPYLALPGNHDLEPAMWQVFREQPHEVVVNGYRIVRFCDREGEGHVPHRTGEDLDRWRELIDCSDDRPQIHLQHYVITPELNVGYPHTYGEGASIRQGNVYCQRCVLCISGHYHKGTELIRDGVCSYVTGTAFCEAPHGFRIYEVGDGGVKSEAFMVNGQAPMANQ